MKTTHHLIIFFLASGFMANAQKIQQPAFQGNSKAFMRTFKTGAYVRLYKSEVASSLTVKIETETTKTFAL